MEEYLLLLIIILLIYFIYKNSKYNKNSNNKYKIKGGNKLDTINKKTNKFVLKYNNIYVSINNTLDNTNSSKEINPPHKLIWEIKKIRDGYTIKNTLNKKTLLKNLEKNTSYELLMTENKNIVNIYYLDKNVTKFVHIKNNLLDISETEKTNFSIEPYRLGLFDKENNIITLYENIANKFNYNKFSTSFTLNFNKIYFSKIHEQINTNLLTNTTEIFNIYTTKHKNHFNYKKYDNNENIENIDYNSSNYIVSNNKYPFFIFNINNLSKTLSTYDNTQVNNLWNINYDNIEKNYTIKNNNKISILRTLGNQFIIGNYDTTNKTNNYIKINNTVLEKTETNNDASIWKMINIIENPKNKNIYCDIISISKNTYSFSENIVNDKNEIQQSSYRDDYESDNIYRVLLINHNPNISNSYIVKNISSNCYLHLVNNKFIWSNAVDFDTIKNESNYHIVFDNYNDINLNILQIEKKPETINTYYISYIKNDITYYLSCSKFNGMLVEDTEKTDNEFIIVPYIKDFRNYDSVSKKQVETNVNNYELNKIYPTISDMKINIKNGFKYRIYWDSQEYYISVNKEKQIVSSSKKDENNIWEIIETNNIYRFYNKANNVFLGQNNIINTEINKEQGNEDIIFNIDFIIKTSNNNKYKIYNSVVDRLLALYNEGDNYIVSYHNSLKNNTEYNNWNIEEVKNNTNEHIRSSSITLKTINNNLITLNCIKKDLLTNILFKIYYNKLKLLNIDYELNMEYKMSNDNIIKILNNINKNIKHISEVNKISLTNEETNINNLFNKTNDIKQILINLHYLLNIEDIENNSNYYEDYYNKPDGELITIGSDTQHKNNLSISIYKKTVLNDGGMHFFDTSTHISSMDVCIYSSNNKFLILDNSNYRTYDDYVRNSTKTSNIYLYNRPAQSIIDNIYSNKKFILNIEYMNDSSYSICNKFERNDNITESYSIPNSQFRLEKIPNKEYEFYIYILDNYQKKYLSDTNDTTLEPITKWNIIPASKIHLYYKNSFNIIKILHNKHKFGKGYDGVYYHYDTSSIDFSQGNFLTYVYKYNKDAIKDTDFHHVYIWSTPNAPNEVGILENTTFPECIEKCNNNNDCNYIRYLRSNNECELLTDCKTFNNDSRWVNASKISNYKEKQGWCKADTGTGHGRRYDKAKVFNRNDILIYKKAGSETLEVVKKYITDNKSNIDKYIEELNKSNDNISKLNETYNLNIKNGNSNINIPLKNIINENKLEDKIHFKLDYNKPYLNIYVKSNNHIGYLTNTGDLVINKTNSPLFLQETYNINHYIEMLYYNNPFYIVGSNNINYINKNKFIRNDHLIYLGNKEKNIYLAVYEESKTLQMDMSFIYQDFLKKVNRDYVRNVELDKFKDKHVSLNKNDKSITSIYPDEFLWRLTYIGSEERIKADILENTTYPECIEKCNNNNNCKYIRYVKSTKTCDLLTDCKIFNNDSRWINARKNNNYKEKIGWCGDDRAINIESTSSKIHKFRLINTEAPHIYLDNIVLEVSDNNKYKIKQGNAYLNMGDTENKTTKKINWITDNEEEYDIIVHKKITNNTFLNNVYKTNKQITNVKFDNKKIINEISGSLYNIPFSAYNTHIFNCDLDKILLNNDYILPSWKRSSSAGSYLIDIGFQNAEINNIYFMMVSNINENNYSPFALYDLINMNKKPVVLTSEKIMISSSWGIGTVNNNQIGMSGNLGVNDIYTYHKAHTQKKINETLFSDYYDIVLMKEHILFSIDEIKTNKHYMEKITVSIVGNNLIIYNCLYKEDLSNLTNIIYFKTYVNKKLENSYNKFSLKFVPCNNSYTLTVYCNNLLFTNVENINLHSLYNGKITKYEENQNNNLNYVNIKNFTYNVLNNPEEKKYNFPISGHRYKISHYLNVKNNLEKEYITHVNTSNKFIYVEDVNEPYFGFSSCEIMNLYTYAKVYSIKRNEYCTLWLGRTKTIITKGKYQAELWVEGTVSTGNIGRAKYFSYDKNKWKWEVGEKLIIVEEYQYSQTTIKKQYWSAYGGVVEFNFDGLHNNSNYVIQAWEPVEGSGVNTPVYRYRTFLKIEKNGVVKDVVQTRNDLDNRLVMHKKSYLDSKGWKWKKTNHSNGKYSIVGYTSAGGRWNGGQMAEEMSFRALLIKHSNELKLETCIFKQHDVKYIKVLNVFSDTTTPGGLAPVGSYFHFNKNDIEGLTKEKYLYIYNPRTNHYYIINVENFTDYMFEHMDKTFANAYGRLLVYKSFNAIPLEQKVEKGDILIYINVYNTLDELDKSNNLGELQLYVSNNIISSINETNNLYDVVNVNGNLRFYNAHFNSYLGENNISDYDNIKESYKISYEKYNNIDFMLEKTNTKQNKNVYYGIKNKNYSRRLFKHNNPMLNDTYNNINDNTNNINPLSYWNYRIDDNSKFLFEHQSKTPYYISRNIYNNNIYLPKNGHRYRIKHLLTNRFLNSGKNFSDSTALSYVMINNKHELEFDVIYENNNYIFYNNSNNEFIGENNVRDYWYTDTISSSYQTITNPVSNNNGDITKILYKLDNTHINSYFSIRNIENNKCFVFHSSANTLSYWRYESDDINFLFTFELIGKTPKSVKNKLRNFFTNTWKLPLIDY